MDAHRLGDLDDACLALLVDPVAARVVGAMGTALEQGLSGGLGRELPPEVAGLLGGVGGAGGAGLGPCAG